MEDWQQLHITKNKVKLLKYTNLNIDLLCELVAVGLLSDVDVENINEEKTCKEKANSFYNILQTRPNSYAALIRILNEQKQTGAVQVLVGCVPSDDISNIQVVLFAEIFPLGSRLDDKDIEEVKATFEMLTTTGRNTEILSHIPSSLTLLKETIPPSISYYVSRRLEKRTTIDPRLFRAPCQDIFVFNNISIINLNRLAPQPNTPDFSTRQLMEISTRFIVLESSGHWDGLKRISKEPIHLIFWDETTKTYKLEATMGRSQILRQFLVHENTNENNNISEDEFIEMCVNSSSVCICDRPGMGKSVLLANIARTIKAKQDDKIVGFIQLSVFIDKIRSNSHLRKFTSTNLKQLIFDVLSTNKLAAAMLLQLDRKRTFHMDLFFDGFDEVSDVALTLKLLSAVRSLPQCRIFVTSRSHMRFELEDTLDILAFNILPFTTDDQVNCLVGIWKSKYDLSNETKLIEFANICLDEFNSIVHDNSNITGIAFQCFLLADVHSKQACNATISSDLIPTERIVIRSLYDIYQKYVDIRIMRETCVERRQKVKLYHAWHALKVVFPEIAETFFKFHKLELVEYSRFLIHGLLEEHHTGDILTHKFLHRTVAEYLVAEVIENILSHDVQRDRNPLLKEIVVYSYKALFSTQKESTFLFNSFMLQPLCNGYKDRNLMSYPIFDVHSFRYNIVLYFLNFRLRPSDLHETKLSKSLTLIRKILRYEIHIEKITNVLIACVFHNFQHILGMLPPFLPPPPSFLDTMVRQFSWSHRTLQSKVMLVAARYSDTHTIDECALIFRLYFDTSSNFLVRTWSSLSPISVAIQRGNFMVFQYFKRITEISCKIEDEFWRLNLRVCLGQSANDSLNVINQKIDIIKYIFYDNSYDTIASNKHPLLSAGILDKKYAVPPALVTSGIHIKLLKFLVEDFSAEIWVNDEFNDTILLQAATSLSPMSGDDYHELVNYLSQHPAARFLFTKKNLEGIAPLHNAVQNVTNLKIDTIKIIVEFGRYSVMDFQTANKDKSVLFSALDGCQSRDIIEFLIEKEAYMIKQNSESSFFFSRDYLTQIISQQTKNSIIRELKDPITYTGVGAAVKLVKIGLMDPIEIIMTLNKALESHFSKMVFSDGDTLLHLFAQCNANALYVFCIFLSEKNFRKSFQKRNNAGRTPLHEAVFHKHVSSDIINILVKNGGGINSLDEHGESVLKTALEVKLDSKLVELLIQLGVETIVI